MPQLAWISPAAVIGLGASSATSTQDAEAASAHGRERYVRMIQSLPDAGVRPARPDEVGAVTAVLADALLDGDLANWLIPNRDKRRSVYPNYFRIFAEYSWLFRAGSWSSWAGSHLSGTTGPGTPTRRASS